MPAGTITLTNNSTAVSGSGTAFPTELKANDFLVAVVGGTTYTLGVKSVESATALTLTTAYGGPTMGGLAWTPIPNGSLVGITAQIAADTARAIRGLNLDKTNWQQVFSQSGNITVELPDGSKFSGPSWNSFANNMKKFLALSDQTIVYSPDTSKALRVTNTEWGLVITNNGNPVPLGVDFGGTGARQGDYWTACGNIGAIRPKVQRFVSGDSPTDNYWKNSTGFITGQMEDGPVGAWIDITSFDNAARMQLIGFYSNNAGRMGFGYKIYQPNSQTWYNFVTVRDTSNTTLDSNGFIKNASPIVDIFSAGDYKTNDESEGVTVNRLGIGEYLIEGCMGLNSDAAWGGIDGGFEIPVDRNKQPRIWLDYKVNVDGSILVKTYHRTHLEAPAFARNLIGHSNDDGSFTESVRNGEPVDIPADSFVSVRVEMPANSIWNQKQTTVVIPEEGELKP